MQLQQQFTLWIWLLTEKKNPSELQVIAPKEQLTEAAPAIPTSCLNQKLAFSLFSPPFLNLNCLIMSFFSLHLHNFSFLKATMKIEQGGHSKTLTRCCSEVGQQFSRPWDLLTVSVLSSFPACPTVLKTWAVSDSKLPMPEYSGHKSH